MTSAAEHAASAASVCSRTTRLSVRCQPVGVADVAVRKPCAPTRLPFLTARVNAINEFSHLNLLVVLATVGNARPRIK
jgi:hypothetical protein